MRGFALAGLATVAALLAVPGAAAAGGESHGPSAGALIVNLTIFFGVLAWLIVPRARQGLRARREQIAADLDAAKRAREQAEVRLAEMDEQLTEVGGQVDQILSAAREQGTIEGERIVAQAGVEAGKIVSQAETRVSDLQAQAERRLRQTAADLAIDLAREMLEKNLGPEDRGRLFKEYLQGLRKVAS